MGKEENSSIESSDSSVDDDRKAHMEEEATPVIDTRPVARVAPFLNSTNGRQNSNHGDHINAADHSNSSYVYGGESMYQPLPSTILHTLNSDESETTIASRGLRIPRYASSNCAHAGSLSPSPHSIVLQMDSLQELEQASETVPKTMDYDEDERGITVEAQGLQELRDPDQTEMKEVADDRESDEQTEVKRVAGCNVD